MKERPILFSAPMVRAILAGTKSQTRRAVKPVGRDGGFVLVEQESGAYWPYRSDDGETTFVTVRERGDECLHEIPMSCPYGQPGDRLWVREAWRADAGHDWARPSDIRKGYRIFYEADDHATWLDDLTHAPSVMVRPSIHMPRWASRITLEVTGVRVERLQDISEADAIAEGCTAKQAEQAPAVDQSRQDYRDLWESINGPGSWDANPWVWAISFRRRLP